MSSHRVEPSPEVVILRWIRSVADTAGKARQLTRDDFTLCPPTPDSPDDDRLDIMSARIDELFDRVHVHAERLTNLEQHPKDPRADINRAVEDLFRIENK